MGASLTIRQATRADEAAIYTFVCELEEQQFDTEVFGKCYRECLGNPHNIYLVAQLNDKPVGYLSCHGQILLHHAGLVYEIQELYILPQYRSMGAGAQLLSALEELIGKEHYEQLEVCSNMRRKDAHRFYLSNGFTQTSYKFIKPARQM